MSDRSQRLLDAKLLAPTPSDETTAFLELKSWLPYMLHRFVATWQTRFSARLQSLGLAFEEWRVLLVASQTGLRNIRSLSEATFIPYSTLQRWLDRMESDRLIERRTLEDDARSVEIIVTAKGRRVFSEAFRVALDDSQQALTGFSPLEYHALMDFLERLQANVSSAL